MKFTYLGSCMLSSWDGEIVIITKGEKKKKQLSKLDPVTNAFLNALAVLL